MKQLFSKIWIIIVFVVILIAITTYLFYPSFRESREINYFTDKFVQALQKQEIKAIEDLLHPDVKEYYSINNPDRIREYTDSLLDTNQGFFIFSTSFGVQVIDITQTYIESGYYDKENQTMEVEEIEYFPVAPQKFIIITLIGEHDLKPFLFTPIARFNNEWFLIVPETKTDWKIYRNKEYGFKVKYPYNSTDVGIGIESLEMSLPLEMSGTRLSRKIFAVNIKEGEYDQTLDYYCMQGMPHTSIENFNGIDFCRSVGVEDVEESIEGNLFTRSLFDYHTIHNKKWIILSFQLFSCSPRLPDDVCGILDKFDEDKEREIFDQILNSFRFLE